MLFRQLVLVACSGFGAVFAGPIQNPHLVLPHDAPTHKQAVENIFLESWAAYKYEIFSITTQRILTFELLRQFAFGHDDLTPVSKSFVDGRNGWGASVVDAMSTMVCRYWLSLYCIILTCWVNP